MGMFDRPFKMREGVGRSDAMRQGRQAMGAPSNFNFGSSPNPFAQLQAMAGGPGSAGIWAENQAPQPPQMPPQGESSPGGFGNVQDYYNPWQSGSMPIYDYNQGPARITAGDVSVEQFNQIPLLQEAMRTWLGQQGLGQQAWATGLMDKQARDLAMLSSMDARRQMQLQRDLGFGGIGAQIYGTQAGLYGQLQGYEQSQREAEMRHALGMRGLDEQSAEGLRRHDQVMGLEDRQQKSRQGILDRLLGEGVGFSGLMNQAGGGISTAPTSFLGQGGGGGSLTGRMGAASAENAADIGAQRLALQNRAAGPGGGMAGAAGIDPMMAHSRMAADTADMQNLRQQLLGERQLGIGALGALGGLV